MPHRFILLNDAVVTTIRFCPSYIVHIDLFSRLNTSLMSFEFQLKFNELHQRGEGEEFVCSFDFVFVLIFHGFFILNKILFIQFELGITNTGVE